ncbi:hypothetical protein WG66_014220 [Moniliophthora roreri]|nr:hypothetical protein WG66_014220 [Moniliophthora roreri]
MTGAVCSTERTQPFLNGFSPLPPPPPFQTRSPYERKKESYHSSPYTLGHEWNSHTLYKHFWKSSPTVKPFQYYSRAS